MTATVLRIPVVAKLECSSCGAKADAACGCGVAYVPAGERAARAVAANPERSDRAIAEELGIGSNTVRRARASAPHGAVTTRTGKDGVTRVLPQREDDDDGSVEDELDDTPENYVAAFWLRVDAATRFAVYAKGPVSRELVIAARQVARAWTQLANQMEKKL